MYPWQHNGIGCLHDKCYAPVIKEVVHVAYVHIEPEVRYFDIVIDDVDDETCRGVWREILAGEDRKALGIKKLELLKDAASTTRVYLEEDVSAEGIRGYLCSKIETWFGSTEFTASRSRGQDRLIINLEKRLEPVAA